jgi:hypothetical protein
MLEKAKALMKTGRSGNVVRGRSFARAVLSHGQKGISNGARTQRQAGSEAEQRDAGKRKTAAT